MSYKDSLIAAGANVLEFANFGDYQGSWFALVEYKGQHGLVKGSYGSCSGCDAFEAEFDYGSPGENTPEYKQKLIAFGESYLNNELLTIDEALAYSKKASDWDLEAKEMISWLKKIRDIKFSKKLYEIIS